MRVYETRDEGVTAGLRRLAGLRIGLLTVLHLAVLAASVLLIVLITRETLRDVSFIDDSRYLGIQFYVCLLFMVDIAVEWMLSRNRRRYLLRHLLFIIVSVPWLNVVHAWGVDVPGQWVYVLRFIPMLRAGYVLALVSGALSRNRATSLMWVYVIFAAASMYFAALMFFVEEHGVNPGVDSLWTSLWWAAMDMTTAGSDINPVTYTGKALSIVLSCEGLILFPVFTVYFTRVVTDAQGSQQKAGAASSVIGGK